MIRFCQGQKNTIKSSQVCLFYWKFQQKIIQNIRNMKEEKKLEIVFIVYITMGEKGYILKK